MKTERELAELIFDAFRATNSKTNHIVMMRTIRFGIYQKLNPKEQEIFFKVLNGLIFTEYITYQQESPEVIRLTQKGYDYIYDDEKVELMLKTPWVIPSTENTNWDKAYFRLWKIIGPQDNAIYYMSGPKFYKFIMDLCDTIPPSYNQYIEQRRKKELSTSRVDYYKDLINEIDEDNRIDLYVNIQKHIENEIVFNNEQINDDALVPEFFIEKQIIEENSSIKTENEVKSDITPTVFISYSWDSSEHEKWVLNLATKLINNGVNVILDKWDLGKLGKLLPNFMESSINKSDRVICIMTPNYKKKTEKLNGGVGYEYSIITAEIFADDINTTKFIPLLKEGDDSNAIPIVLKGRKYVDMRNEDDFENKFFNELLRDIFDEPMYKKPKIGKKPDFK